MVARTLLNVTLHVLYTACLVLYISSLLLLFFLRLNNNYPSNFKIQMAVGYNTEVKKFKLHLSTPWRHVQEVEVQLYPFLTSALNGYKPL